MSKLNKASTSIKQWVRENIHNYSLLLFILIYIIAFSGHMLAKNRGFGTFAWDLGIFDQSFYTTIFEGKMFYSTAELYQNPSGSYFGSKFSPVLFLLLPFYILAPCAENLLVLKTIILAIAAYPLFLLTKALTADKQTSLFVALSYLLYPGLHGANNFDFQQQLFIPVIIFSLVYSMVKKKWGCYIIFCLLSLSITEHVAIIVFLLSSYQLIHLVWAEVYHENVSTMKKTLLASMILSIASFFILKHIRTLYPVNHQFIDFYQASSTFQVLAFNGNILYLPLYLIQNLDKVLEAISYDFIFKFLYMIFLFAPLLFISFNSRLTLGSVILATPFIISNYRPYYILGSHYSLYLLPFIFLAFIEGLSRNSITGYPLTIDENVKSLIRDEARVVLLVSIIFAFCLSPLSPVSTIIKRSYPLLWYSDTYQSNEYVDSLHSMIDLVPPQSSILVQNTIFPHVSNRLNAHVVPVITSPEVKNYLEAYIRNQVNESEYILIDLEAYDIWKGYLMEIIQNKSDIRPYAFTRSTILFRKNFFGDPIFVPAKDHQVFLAYSDMHYYWGSPVKDQTTKIGYSIFSPKQKTSGAMIYGPYIALPPGYYEIIFTVKIMDYNDSDIAVFDVCDEVGNTILARKPMNSSMVQLGDWVNVSIPFYVEKLRFKMEFRIFTTGSADIYCDKITVKKTQFQNIEFYSLSEHRLVK